MNHFCQKIPKVMSFQECPTRCVIPFSTLVHEDVVEKMDKRTFSNHFVHHYLNIWFNWSTYQALANRVRAYSKSLNLQISALNYYHIIVIPQTNCFKARLHEIRGEFKLVWNFTLVTNPPFLFLINSLETFLWIWEK